MKNQGEIKANQRQPQKDAQFRLRKAAEQADMSGVRAALHEGADPKILPEELAATVDAMQRRFAEDIQPGVVEFEGIEESSAIGTAQPPDDRELIQRRLRSAAERADAEEIRKALKDGANPSLLPEQLAATVEAIQRRFGDGNESWSNLVGEASSRRVDILR